MIFDHFFPRGSALSAGPMASLVFISVKTQKTEKIHFNVNLFSKTTDRLLVYRRKI